MHNVIQRTIKSKTIKVLLIALVLVFSYEVNKPKAAAPLVAWGASILAGLMVEQAASMGIKWASKNAAKKKGDEWAAAMWNKADAEPFDFAKTNPYRNKDGSVLVTPSAADRARIASFIAGTAGGIIAENLLTKDSDLELAQANDTSFSMTSSSASTDLFWGWVSFAFSPYILQPGWNSGGMRYYFWLHNEVTGLGYTQTHNSIIAGGESYRYAPIETGTIADACPYLNTFTSPSETVPYKKTDIICPPIMTIAYEQYMKVHGMGEQLYFDEGITYPSTIQNVYNYNYQDYIDDIYLDNFDQLANKPVRFPNLMPPVAADGEITWSDIENNYPDAQTIDAVIDANDDAYYADGDMATTEYNEDVIYNYYFGAQPATQVPTVPGTGETPSDLDHSIWEVMRNTYNYLDDGIDASLESMKGITDSAQGLTTYLNNTMSWLPPEYRAMIASAFVLGVFAHFLRR